MQAFIFPGQGSQRTGMGRDVYDRSSAARAVFEEADEALRFKLSRLCFDGPEEELRLTENTQPAILTVSVAILRVLAEGGLKPDLVAGHSLGEYSALVAAGSLDFADAVRTVRQRGRFMQKAVPVGEGAMAAVLNLRAGEVERVCKDAADGQVVEPANLNAPGQIVIAGHATAVERACDLARERGALRTLMLPVSAPFHCSLMRPAGERLAEVLENLEFSDLRVPLVNNVDAKLVREAGEARRGLIRQVSSAVRWHESVEAMIEAGVERFFEVGPGNVLTGLAKRIDRSVEASPISDWGQIESHV